MPSQIKPSGQAATLSEVTETVEALDRVMHDMTDVKKTEWRPRQSAAIARRLGRFEAEMQRNSLKPPAA
jgi:hypothetical protein